jgi:ABC-type multidrug transport system fused ATPase/permease subunit
MLNLLRRLWSHITRRGRIRLGLIFCLMLTAPFAEIFSIGIMVPFLGVLTAPEIVSQYEFVKWIVIFFGLTSQQELLHAFFVLFVIAIVIAATNRILLVWLQARVILVIVNELATDAYTKILSQPYATHIARNSSEILSGILSKVTGGVGGGLNAVLTLISSQLILAAIIVALVVINPVMALTTFIGFGGIYGLIMIFTQKELSQQSEEINRTSTEVVKVLQEGLGGIRDVLLDSSQLIYGAKYQRADIKLRNAQAKIQFISASPRFIIEAIGMIAIAMVAYALSSRPGGLAGVIPLMGALAIGAQRTLPLLQQSYASWALMLGTRASLQDALDLLEQPAKSDLGSLYDHDTIRFNRSICLDQVFFQYNSIDPAVIKNVSIALPKGGIIGFIGETGSGKSTLLDIIMGLLQPSSGQLRVDNQVIDASNQSAWQKHIAHVPQAIFLSDATVAENIAFGISRGAIDMTRVRLAARQAQIADSIESWTHQYDTIVGERGVRLSGGQRQRLGIARALYKESEVIIFDEATSALDNETEGAVMETILSLAGVATILIVAHRLTTLKNCTQIVELKSGAVVRIGSYVDVIENR